VVVYRLALREHLLDLLQASFKSVLLQEHFLKVVRLGLRHQRVKWAVDGFKIANFKRLVPMLGSLLLVIFIDLVDILVLLLLLDLLKHLLDLLFENLTTALLAGDTSPEFGTQPIRNLGISLGKRTFPVFKPEQGVAKDRVAALLDALLELILVFVKINLEKRLRRLKLT